MYLCMTHVFFRRLLHLGGHRMLVSLPLCCWLFLALLVSSFPPFLQILLLSESFLPIGPLSLSCSPFSSAGPKYSYGGGTDSGASSKGNANSFDAESETSFPVIEISLSIAARERDNEKDTPHLASVPVKIHKRVPHPHILHPHTPSSPGDLVLFTLLVSPSPLSLSLSAALNPLALQAPRAPCKSEESPCGKELA